MLERRNVTTRDGALRADIVASADLIYFSGVQPETTEGDVKEQMRSALARLDALLAEMGEDQKSLFVIHIWLKDMRYFGGMNAVWNEWADAEAPPARTCVSGELSRPDLLVELIATACRTEG